jgi:hypothetical protein
VGDSCVQLTDVEQEVTVSVTRVPGPLPTVGDAFALIVPEYVPELVPLGTLNTTLHDFVSFAAPLKLSVVGVVETQLAGIPFWFAGDQSNDAVKLLPAPGDVTYCVKATAGLPALAVRLWDGEGE